MTEPLFRKIDCLRLPVPGVEAGLRFYRDALGHELIWRTATAAGLRLPDSNAELVIHNEGTGTETDLMVEAVGAAVERIVVAGGHVLRPIFDIAIGKCAVVADPFGNVLVLLDSSKGLLVTDVAGNVIGR
ncbi:MAG: VOC family protein [Chloroflexota bacterium]|nr:VOC family protein [Chloroflexota bacterium]